MPQVRIVLVEPAGALNVGSIARVMKNMGLDALWLVNPQFDLGSDRYARAARDMAVHGQEILEGAVIVDELPQALADCQRAIATTGRSDTKVEPPASALEWLVQPNAETVAIVFGREDRGLTNDELALCQRNVQIPVSASYPSLNLAQAVAICCYELRLVLVEASNSNNQTDLANIEHVEAYYQDLETVLVKIGYLHPHTAFSRMQKLRHLFNKAELTKLEVDMLRGMIRQINWVADHSN